jgi:hypothetical protein
MLNNCSLACVIWVWSWFGITSATVKMVPHVIHVAREIPPRRHLFIDFFVDKYMYVAILSILLLKKR